MIVAGDDEKAAPLCRSLEISELQGFARPVDAEALAVPEPEDALIARRTEPAQLLGAADRGGGEFLVEARREAHVIFVEKLLRPP
jgi:hypothetical protein